MNPYFVFGRKPFIVMSRKQPAVFQILMRDSYPVLFEGLHTTFFLRELKAAGKKCFVRTHNIEHAYYSNLAKAENSLVRKGFYKLEARKLKKYEPVLSEADGLITISANDQKHFSKLNDHTIFIHPFHPEPDALNEPGSEKFAFYHGNLDVPENKKAAEFLMDEVVSGMDLKLVIAGKSADGLKKKTQGRNVVLIDSPSDEELLNWACRASVHLLPTFQTTGFKLKFIYSLYTARAIIANNQMVKGTGLEEFVHLANGASEWKRAISKCLENIESKSVIKRNTGLSLKISNASLSEKLIQFLR